MFNIFKSPAAAGTGFRSVGNAMGGVAVHRPPLERAASCDMHGAYLSLCHVGRVWLGCSRCSALEQDAKQAREDRRVEDERMRAWEARLGRAGIPERFQDRTLDNYVVTTHEQSVALRFSQAYAYTFSDVLATGRSAIFSGGVGTGKTHLAVGIGQRVMDTHRATVLFVVAARIMRMVKDSWSKGSGKTESDVIRELVFPDLLIIDEVGVQQGTEFERGVMFDVLNERYEQRKPTLLLTNCVVQELERKYLGERVIDRIREDGGEIVAFDWASYRSQPSGAV